MRMDNWMEHEKEAYRQLDDYRLSALYSGNDIGEDPELRENFLLDFFKIDRRNYYNLITSQVNSLNANPNITSLSFLEGLFLIEIENAINN